MKSNYTAKEIAAALNISERAVRSAAQKGLWPHEKCPVRGGHEYRFLCESIPIDIRRAILAHELDLSVEFVPPREIPETELKALLSRFQAAPEYNRQRAIARCEILDALAAYHKASGLAVTKAEKGFVELYKIQAAPGISSEVYSTEPKFSVGTLRRWKRQFKESGLAGLLTEYGKKKAGETPSRPKCAWRSLGKLAPGRTSGRYGYGRSSNTSSTATPRISPRCTGS